MTLPDNETLTKLATDATPGPWSTDCMEIHGKKYGGLWVRGADVVEDDGQVGPLMVKLTGSHGAASYTGEIVAAQNHDDNDANACLIALAPTLAAEVIAMRAAMATAAQITDDAVAQLGAALIEIADMFGALEFAEAALADIGDAEREEGDDLAWCESRAAKALPRVRAALTAYRATVKP